MTSDAFRALIREIIAKELDEITTSGATPGFQTPNAFQGPSGVGKKKHQSNVDVTREYTQVEPDERPDTLKEGRSRYHELKLDDSATAVQKIGRLLSELNKSISEMERTITMAARLKTETGTPSTDLWKRSLSQLVKIEGRVIRLAHRIKELKS